jgi:lipopolysaccharide transport system permease protein
VAAGTEETVISAERANQGYLADLWRYRELLAFLAWRDLLVRYKQTVVGAAWALIRPLLTMLVLTFVFGRLGQMPAAGSPYPLLVLCGILPWQFFAAAVSESGNSLVSNSSLISKVYFPRLVIPVGSLITACADVAIALVFLAALMAWYGWVPPLTVFLAPAFFALALLVSLGAGLWLAALTVRYRDIKYIVPFAVQFGLYVSPVGFVSAVVPESYRLLYALNPMVGVIDGFRWSILGGAHALYWPAVLLSAVSGLILVWTGLLYFRRTERTFADVI